MPELDTVVRVSLILGFALLAMPLLKSRSASARRMVMAAALLASLVVPFAPKRAIRVERPAVIQQLAAEVIQEPASSSEAAPARITVASSVEWLALLWILGAMTVGARFAVGFLHAERLVRKARRSVEWPADVRLSRDLNAPAVAGLIRPVILIPDNSESWSAERREAVLLHERSHIAAHDIRLQFAASVVLAIHWFNPLAWLAVRRLRLERELAADEAALGTGIRPTNYAHDLLAIAGHAPLGTIAISEKPLSKRIKAIIASKRPRRLTIMGKTTLLSLTSLIALGVACTNVMEPMPTSTTAAPVAKPATAPPSSDLQTLATSELTRTIAAWHADGGAILVLKPTGEVVAQAGDVDKQVAVGSVMKPFLLATALESGAIEESDVGDDLAKSSNAGFTRIFERVSNDKHRATLEHFGFAVPAKLDAPLAIGATMTGTPRQVAKAYAMLSTNRDVTTQLERVITSAEGTGKKARIEGVRVAGKTGTSEWTTPGAKHTYASFVGYVPAEAPKVIVYVGIESPHGENPWGGEVAAPVFARVAANALLAN